MAGSTAGTRSYQAMGIGHTRDRLTSRRGGTLRRYPWHLIIFDSPGEFDLNFRGVTNFGSADRVLALLPRVIATGLVPPRISVDHRPRQLVPQRLARRGGTAILLQRPSVRA